LAGFDSGQEGRIRQALDGDPAARIERVTTTNNGAYRSFVYGPNYVQSFATVNNIADEAYANTVFDGMGRTVVAATNHPGIIANRYSAVNTIYDHIGPAGKTIESHRNEWCLGSRRR
jgi:hypothetical protein